MLAEAIRDQIHASQATPIHVAGGSVTMMPCRTEVLVGVRDLFFMYFMTEALTYPRLGF